MNKIIGRIKDAVDKLQNWDTWRTLCQLKKEGVIGSTRQNGRECWFLLKEGQK